MPEAEPVHARVDLEMAARAARRARAAAASSARAAAGVETVGVSRCVEHAVEIADAERAEHEDRNRHAGVAQRDALLDVRARQHRRARRFERRPDRAPRRGRRRWL